MASYRDAGVDLELSKRCSQLFYEAALRTFSNRKGRFGEPEVAPGAFSGPIYVSRLEDAYLMKNSDGVGTKIEVAERLGEHESIAFDLLAMTCDDAAAVGAEPFAVTNTLNVRDLDVDRIHELAEGLVRAAQRARVAVVGGEIAVLGKRIGGEYTWDADVIAVLERGKRLDPGNVRPGDPVIGLREEGFRSNGFSLIREVLERRHGPDWVHCEYDARRTWGEAALTPSVIYTPLIVDAVGPYGEGGKASIKAAAHITGGGIPGNLPRCLPKGLGARLDVLPPEPVLRLQELGGVPDEEAYRVWNMGVGMVVVTDDERLTQLAGDYGVKAEVIGEVTDEPRVRIENRGWFQEEGELRFEL